MKTKFYRSAVFGLALAGAPFVGGCKENVSLALAEIVPPAPAVEPALISDSKPNPPAVGTVAETKVEPVQPTVTKPLPAEVKLSSNAAQIVKLAQAGVDETIMLSFVTNSTGTFNLGSEEIIYLNDLGVENSVLTAMIEHDRLLVSASQNPAPAPATTPAYATTEPAPAQVATEAAYVAPPTQPVTMNYFYSSLAPYGSWVEIDGYGRCWQPTVAVVQPTWQPYSDRGHWIYTDCGWYWYSDYSWGYSTFHYGRWFRHPRYGWCWNPDTVWGPAWVTWRYSNDYCGWAPLPPHSYYRPGIGFTYYDRSVGFGFSFGLSADCYTFVPLDRFCDSRPYRYRAPRTRITNIYNNTTVINNYVSGNNNTIINHGIPVDRVSAATRTPIRPVAIHETPGNTWNRGERVGRRGSETVIYRPPASSSLSVITSRREETSSSNVKSVLPKANPGERRRSESTDSTVSTTKPGVLTKANPIGERRGSKSISSTGNQENRNVRATTESSTPATVTTTERNNTEISRRQPGSPRTDTHNTVNNNRTVSPPTVIGSNERREKSVQPRTTTATTTPIANQVETITRPNRETTPPNALIFRGNREHSQVPATPSVQTEQAALPRNSVTYTSPRIESSRSRVETRTAPTTVVAPRQSVQPRVERLEPVRSTPVFSPRVERQESYRPSPVISHREPATVSSSPSIRSQTSPNQTSAPQSVRSSQGSQQQSRNYYPSGTDRSERSRSKDRP